MSELRRMFGGRISTRQASEYIVAESTLPVSDAARKFNKKHFGRDKSVTQIRSAVGTAVLLLPQIVAQWCGLTIRDRSPGAKVDGALFESRMAENSPRQTKRRLGLRSQNEPLFFPSGLRPRPGPQTGRKKGLG